MSPDALREHLTRGPVDGAKALIGCLLVHGERVARIIETEAYGSIEDPGSHAHRGRTPRNEAMFGRPGLAYVYLNYGCHWLMNVVTMAQDCASAVLIRAAIPISGVEGMREARPNARRDEELLSGPGKLSAALGIDARHYGVDLLDGNSALRLEPGRRQKRLLVTTRVGLATGKGEQLPWRFIDPEALAWSSTPRCTGKITVEGWDPQSKA